jgi:hypothetical protein
MSALIPPGSCTGLASAYLKSRSSDSFTAAMKDFVPPQAVNINTCGKVIIRKVTEPVSDPDTVKFTYTKNFSSTPTTANTFQLGHGQSKEIPGVPFGTGYTVNETTLPATWQFKSVDCSASTGVTVDTSAAPLITFAIDSASDVVDCTYTNEQHISTISTEQSFTPQDTATISGTGLAFDGTVTFKLHKGVLGDSAGETCANTTDPVKYTEVVANANLVNPNSTPASRTASTSNSSYSIKTADAGSFYWEVFYNGTADPDVTSCVEKSTVSPINNGGAVSSG